jgi:hypothetical protein
MASVEKFIEQLEAVPWFANLGKPSPRDEEVFRIYHWDTWPGPEDPGSELHAAFLQHWHDDLFQPGKGLSDLRQAWEAIEGAALRLAKASVPYKEEEDTWHGPTAAAWHAAYTAALVGCTLRRDGRLKPSADARMQWTLSNEWSWFLAGHWPCQYYWPWGHSDIGAAHRTGGPKRLIVY